MNKDKKFAYIDAPTLHTPPFLNENVNLQEIYSSCIEELTLQQSKRDQLINFYLTITGLVATYLFSTDVDFKIRIAIFLVLFFIGCMWSTIAIRYKTYKDIYWICCKTISSLFSVDRKQIDKACVQHTFYRVMEKCYKTIPQNCKGKPMLLKHVVKTFSSAEYLMFLTLVLLSAMSGSVCILILLLKVGLGVTSYAVVAMFFVFFVIIQTLHYNKSCISVYNVLIDKSDASFNKIFEKAWFLHFFSQNNA